jgi:hypothetical protein
VSLRSDPRELTEAEAAVSSEALSDVAVRSRSVSLAVAASTWTRGRLETEVRRMQEDLNRVRHLLTTNY